MDLMPRFYRALRRDEIGDVGTGEAAVEDATGLGSGLGGGSLILSRNPRSRNESPVSHCKRELRESECVIELVFDSLVEARGDTGGENKYSGVGCEKSESSEEL